MEMLGKCIDALNWSEVNTDMHQRGYSLEKEFLNQEQCQAFKDLYREHSNYRKTVVMERYRFGQGEYKYFDYPLPERIEFLRSSLYPRIAPIANQWMQVLKIDKHFPNSFQELQLQCHENNQLKPTPLILKYGKGGFNTLHQDLYGEIYFPIQVVLFLSDPKEDFSGGEFVLTQQTPRAQSKAIVLQPGQGDMLLFTTNFRPVKGKRGYYRVNMKHGVSEVHNGERYTLGIIFHDAGA